MKIDDTIYLVPNSVEAINNGFSRFGTIINGETRHFIIHRDKVAYDWSEGERRAVIPATVREIANDNIYLVVDGPALPFIVRVGMPINGQIITSLNEKIVDFTSYRKSNQIKR